MLFGIGIACYDCEKVYWNSLPEDQCPVNYKHFTTVWVKPHGTKPWEDKKPDSKFVKQQGLDKATYWWNKDLKEET